MNLLIVGLFFIFMYIIGVNAKNYLKLRHSPILIGFLTIIALFQLSYYFAVFLKFPVEQYYHMVTFAIGALVFFSIYKIKQKNLQVFPKITNKLIIKLCLITIIWITTILYGKINSDSWLFLPLVLSPLQNGTIGTYNAGIHAFDGYYGFISYVAHFTKAEYTLFLVNWWTLIQATLIVLSYDAILIHLKTKNHTLILIIMVLATFLGFYFILPYFGTNEIPYHVYNILPSGTLFFYVCSVPLIVLSLLERKTNYKTIIMLVLASFAFSSSSLFVLGYLALIMVIFLHITKTKNIKKYQHLVIMITILCINGLFFAIYADVNKTISIAILIMLFFSVLGNYYFACSLHHHKFDIIKRTLFWISILLITITWINYLFFMGTPWQQFSAIFTQSLSQRGVPYSIGFQNMLLVMIWVTTFIYVWKLKRYRKYNLFTATAFITYCNAVMYLGSFEDLELVYHRVIMLLSLYWYPLLAIDDLLKKREFKFLVFLKSRHNIKIWLALVMIFFTWVINPNLFFSETGMYNPFEESYTCYKVDNDDACQALSVENDKEVNVYSEASGRDGINKIFWYNTNYHRVDTIPESDYYIIPKNSKLQYSDIVILETESYLIYKN